MKEKKCFGCREFRHIICNCRNVGEEGLISIPSNIFEVLRSRMMQRGEESEREVGKDRKMILKEERAKKMVEVQNIEVEKKDSGKRKEKSL